MSLAAKIAVGRSITGQDPSGEGARLVPPVGAVPDPLVGNGDPGRRKLLGQAQLAIPARGEAERICQRVPDERDRGMAELEEVARGEHAAGRVVADDPRHGRDRRRVHVDEDHRDRTADECRERLGGRGQRHDDQPVRALRVSQRTEVVVPLLDGLDVVDDEVELAVREDGIDTTQPLRRLGTGQERHHDADRERATEAEASGGRARSETQLLHHGEDPIARPGLTTWLPFSAREAVATLTPACRATSRMVTDFLATADRSAVTGFMRPVTSR